MNNYLWVFFSLLSLFSLVANYVLNKALSVNYSPFLAITITGIVQFFLGGIFFVLSGEKLSNLTTHNFMIASLVAVCVIGIDYGMITAYKFGGNAILITLIVSMATVIMVPISLLIYKERISLIQTVGVILGTISILMVVLFPPK